MCLTKTSSSLLEKRAVNVKNVLRSVGVGLALGSLGLPVALSTAVGYGNYKHLNHYMNKIKQEQYNGDDEKFRVAMQERADSDTSKYRMMFSYPKRAISTLLNNTK